MVKQPTLNEVLELRRVLYIIEVPYQQHSTCDVSFYTGWDPWLVGGTSHLEAAANTSRVRMPLVKRVNGELVVEGKEQMERDFATAVARMNDVGSRYRQLGVPDRMFKMVVAASGSCCRRALTRCSITTAVSPTS